MNEIGSTLLFCVSDSDGAGILFWCFMKPKFIVQETQEGAYAVFRFNALTGSFEQHFPKTGYTSKEGAEEMCEECNHLADEERSARRK